MLPIHARRLASVTPDLAAVYLQVSQEFAAAFPGCVLTPAQGYRTPAQQQAASAAGKSNANGTSTFSKHQAYPALALDFAVLDPAGLYVADGKDPRYAWVGQRFEMRGFKWGGRWEHAPPDWDHVESAEPGPSDVVGALALYQKAIADAPFLAL